MVKRSGEAPISFLPPAANIQISGGSFVQNNTSAKDIQLQIYDQVAPNAILNAGGRADPVGCYPGTREEVLSKIEKWIGGHETSNRGIFWLSGPAGAGKSAIVQTIAERCIERNIPMANFFFFRADSTRNHSGSVVATLLYQLFQLFPEWKELVMAITTQNPVILRQPIRDQFSALIHKPFGSIRETSGKERLVILIDGLDECGSDSGKLEQTSLLRVLHDLTMQGDHAFMILVASRTEGHLTMTFNEIGISPDSIYLDESYRPSDDIQAFLTQEFSRIKQTHGLRDTLDANWPHSADLDFITKKSSGQFIYAATVTRFVANSTASPKRSLEIVLGLRPVAKTSPFATLDTLYAFILSQAEDWKSVQDILAAQRVISLRSWKASSTSIMTVLFPLGYIPDDIHSSLSDLTSIVQFKHWKRELTVFHASLNDFLYDRSRAGSFYIDLNAFACRIAPLHFKQVTNLHTLYCSFQILESVTEPDGPLTDFLQSFFPNPEPFRQDSLSSDMREHWMKILATLYRSRDPGRYKIITNHWNEWFRIVIKLAKTGTGGDKLDGIHIESPIKLQRGHHLGLPPNMQCSCLVESAWFGICASVPHSHSAGVRRKRPFSTPARSREASEPVHTITATISQSSSRLPA